jgi:hypothetical protein
MYTTNKLQPFGHRRGKKIGAPNAIGAVEKSLQCPRRGVHRLHAKNEKQMVITINSEMWRLESHQPNFLSGIICQVEARKV